MFTQQIGWTDFLLALLHNKKGKTSIFTGFQNTFILSAQRISLQNVLAADMSQR